MSRLSSLVHRVPLILLLIYLGRRRIVSHLLSVEALFLRLWRKIVVSAEADVKSVLVLLSELKVIEPIRGQVVYGRCGRQRQIPRQ